MSKRQKQKQAHSYTKLNTMPGRKILPIATTWGWDLERTKNLFKSVRKRQAPFTFYILKSKNYEYALTQRETRDRCERMFTAPAFREMHMNEDLIFFPWGLEKLKSTPLWCWWEGGKLSTLRVGVLVSPASLEHDLAESMKMFHVYVSRLNHSIRSFHLQIYLHM